MPELWPLRPLREISESLEWLTEVLPSRTGEQRIALRSAPRQILSYSHIFDAHKYMWAKAFTRRNGAVPVDVPVWIEKVGIGNVSASQDTLTFNPLNGDFRIGGKLVVWKNWEEYSVGTIVSLTDTGVVLEEPVGVDLQSASVMPVREAFFTQGLRSERIPTAARAYVRFQVIDNIDLTDAASSYIDELSLYPVYEDLDVVTDSPHASAPVTENIVRTSEFIDNGFGPVSIEPLYNFADFGQTITFLPSLGSELWSRRRWLHSLRGRQKSFWLPSFNQDLELQSPVTMAGTTLTVRRVSVPGFYVDRHIMISLRNGNRYFRSITNAVINGDNDDLTISSALGEAITSDDVLYISFISKMRSNSDIITLDHNVPNLVSITIPVSEVQ